MHAMYAYSHFSLVTARLQKMETHEVDSCVRVFWGVWNPTTGEQLVCKRETSNTQDVYTVAVMHGAVIVGHVLRRISTACTLFLRRKGTIQCTISGRRWFSADLPQGGLDIPCVLKFQGDLKDVAKMRKLVTISTTALLARRGKLKKVMIYTTLHQSHGWPSMELN